MKMFFNKGSIQIKWLVIIILLIAVVAIVALRLFQGNTQAKQKTTTQQMKTAEKVVCNSSSERVKVPCNEITSGQKECGIATAIQKKDCNGDITYDHIDASNCKEASVFQTISCNRCGEAKIYACPAGLPPASSTHAKQFINHNNLWLWTSKCSVTNASSCK